MRDSGYYCTVEEFNADFNTEFETLGEITEYLVENSILYYDDESAEESFQEILDESGPIDIWGMSFYPSTIIEEVDPIAYLVSLGDYQASLSEEFVYLDF